ncbi:MAG: RNHCP domain-containing protein [bacterium]|nr:RNHCP domain-containing protein [bacterium]
MTDKRHYPGQGQAEPRDKGVFTCVHCHTLVLLKALGTQNRNHCPRCLWSRHVDESVGDRSADCLESMEPIGLTTKSNQELMLVHRCTGCGKVSKNRLAGDDDNSAVIGALENSKTLDLDRRQSITASGVVLCQDRDLVIRQLFGGRGR